MQALGRHPEVRERPDGAVDHRVRAADVDVPAVGLGFGGQVRDRAVQGPGDALGGGRDADGQRRVLPLHRPQRGQVVQGGLGPRAEQQGDLASAGEQRLGDRLHRGQAGTAAQAQRVPGRIDPRRHRPLGRAEQHGIPGVGVQHRRADQAAGHDPDVQGQRPVRGVPRRVGDRVAAPHAGPAGRLHRRVLAGGVRVALARTQGQHGHLRGPHFMADDLGRPPGRPGVRAGGAGHELGGPADGRGPFQFGPAPGVRRVPPERDLQGLGERAVVLRPHAELPVRAPQPRQGRLQPGIAGPHPGGDPAQRGVQPAPLISHRGREHRPDLGVGGEQPAVEVGHGRVGGGVRREEIRSRGRLGGHNVQCPIGGGPSQPIRGDRVTAASGSRRTSGCASS